MVEYRYAYGARVRFETIVGIRVGKIVERWGNHTKQKRHYRIVYLSTSFVREEKDILGLEETHEVIDG